MSMNFLLSDSGRSLSSLIYEGNHPVRRSSYWYELRRNSHHLMRDMVTSLINTVAFLHSREIYHRDIKPDNILIGDRGEITLVDFGSAWDEYISRHGLFGTTGPSEKEETARYSPPEFRWSYSMRSSSVDEFAAYVTLVSLVLTYKTHYNFYVQIRCVVTRSYSAGNLHRYASRSHRSNVRKCLDIVVSL